MPCRRQGPPGRTVPIVSVHIMNITTPFCFPTDRLVSVFLQRRLLSSSRAASAWGCLWPSTRNRGQIHLCLLVLGNFSRRHEAPLHTWGSVCTCWFPLVLISHLLSSEQVPSEVILSSYPQEASVEFPPPGMFCLTFKTTGGSLSWSSPCFL